MKNTSKKLISTILALVMLLSVLSVAAFAEVQKISVQLPGGEAFETELEDTATVADLKAAIVEYLNANLKEGEEEYTADTIHFFADGKEIEDAALVSELKNVSFEITEVTREEQQYPDMLEELSKGQISTQTIHEIVQIVLIAIKLISVVFGFNFPL